MAIRGKRSAKTTTKAGKPARKVRPTPAGYEGITPYLTVRGAAQALAFYKKAFGARELTRLSAPDGRIMHAEMKVFDRIVMLSDEAPDQGRLAPESLKGTPVGLFVYSVDVDKALARAVAAGATLTMPAQDMFWGDRFGSIRDPAGHSWQIATHKEDVPPRETQRRWRAMMAQG
jgi:uncharacterized glyoxalase superfamily protein PhnB